eukprot:jgi/Galph1/1077/GphlegSOOS_G5898.1
MEQESFEAIQDLSNFSNDSSFLSHPNDALRKQESEIQKLKKLNFNLKLRICQLEERLGLESTETGENDITRRASMQSETDEKYSPYPSKSSLLYEMEEEIHQRDVLLTKARRVILSLQKALSKRSERNLEYQRSPFSDGPTVICSPNVEKLQPSPAKVTYSEELERIRSDRLVIRIADLSRRILSKVQGTECSHSYDDEEFPSYDHLVYILNNLIVVDEKLEALSENVECSSNKHMNNDEDCSLDALKKTNLRKFQNSQEKENFNSLNNKMSDHSYGKDIHQDTTKISPIPSYSQPLLSRLQKSLMDLGHAIFLCENMINSHCVDAHDCSSTLNLDCTNEESLQELIDFIDCLKISQWNIMKVFQTNQPDIEDEFRVERPPLLRTNACNDNNSAASKGPNAIVIDGERGDSIITTWNGTRYCAFQQQSSDSEAALCQQESLSSRLMVANVIHQPGSGSFKETCDENVEIIPATRESHVLDIRVSRQIQKTVQHHMSIYLTIMENVFKKAASLSFQFRNLESKLQVYLRPNALDMTENPRNAIENTHENNSEASAKNYDFDEDVWHERDSNDRTSFFNLISFVSGCFTVLEDMENELINCVDIHDKTKIRIQLDQLFTWSQNVLAPSPFSPGSIQQDDYLLGIWKREETGSKGLHFVQETSSCILQSWKKVDASMTSTWNKHQLMKFAQSIKASVQHLEEFSDKATYRLDLWAKRLKFINGRRQRIQQKLASARTMKEETTSPLKVIRASSEVFSLKKNHCHKQQTLRKWILEQISETQRAIQKTQKSLEEERKSVICGWVQSEKI